LYNLPIKPLTVNQCYTGRRFKTDKYKAFKRDIQYLLPKIKIPEGALKLSIIWGFSNVACDADNPVKPFQDILQERYGFNDKQIYELHIKKTIVKKGQEFIKFEIEAL